MPNGHTTPGEIASVAASDAYKAGEAAKDNARRIEEVAEACRHLALAIVHLDIPGDQELARLLAEARALLR